MVMETVEICLYGKNKRVRRGAPHLVERTPIERVRRCAKPNQAHGGAPRGAPLLVEAHGGCAEPYIYIYTGMLAHTSLTHGG